MRHLYYLETINRIISLKYSEHNSDRHTPSLSQSNAADLSEVAILNYN